MRISLWMAHKSTAGLLALVTVDKSYPSNKKPLWSFGHSRFVALVTVCRVGEATFAAAGAADAGARSGLRAARWSTLDRLKKQIEWLSSRSLAASSSSSRLWWSAVAERQSECCGASDFVRAVRAFAQHHQQQQVMPGLQTHAHTQAHEPASTSSLGPFTELRTRLARRANV